MNKKQILHSGNSTILDFENLLKNDSPQRIFLVTGKKSYEKSGAKLLFENILLKHSFVQFSNFSENPKLEDVRNGIDIFVQNKCDYVIAIGGGSVIDMAKLINVGQANLENLSDLILGNLKIDKCGKKLIAIPTTSGAGSEATHFAVVYIDSVKYSLAHQDFILPDCVFLIPQLTYTLSKYQTAVSGVDALAQAIESYWSINSNDESKFYAKFALKIILKNLPIVVNDNNLKSRQNMLIASYLSGRAINISKTTGAHAMAYNFTSKFNIPHGHAVALTLSSWFRINSNTNDENVFDERGAEYVLKTMNELSMLISGEDNKRTSQYIKDFIKGIGLEVSLSKLNIKYSDLKLILDNINLQRLANNPRKVTKNELVDLLNEIYS